MRQLRVNYFTACQIPKETHQYYKDKCFGEFNPFAMDDRNYTPMWRDHPVVGAYLTNRRAIPFLFQPLGEQKETFQIYGRKKFL